MHVHTCQAFSTSLKYEFPSIIDYHRELSGDIHVYVHVLIFIVQCYVCMYMYVLICRY